MVWVSWMTRVWRLDDTDDKHYHHQYVPATTRGALRAHIHVQIPVKCGLLPIDATVYLTAGLLEAFRLQHDKHNQQVQTSPFFSSAYPPSLTHAVVYRPQVAHLLHGLPFESVSA